MAIFPTDLALRATVKITDKLLIHNIDTGVTEYTTVDKLLDALGIKGQVKFPAVQVPSADVNTLDDYEEGTWAPVISFGGASVGVTYSTQLGYYTKIGNVVTVWGFLILTSKGSSNGAARIITLPFTSGIESLVVLKLNKITFADQYDGFVLATTTYINLGEITNAGVSTDLTDADFANDSDIRFNCIYRV